MLPVLLASLLISAVFPAPAPKLVIITGPDGDIAERLLIVEEEGVGDWAVGEGEGDADWTSVENQPDNGRPDGDTGYYLDSLPDLTGRSADSDSLLLYPGYRDPKTLRDMAEAYDDQVLRELARLEDDKRSQMEGDVEEAREKGRTVGEARGKEQTVGESGGRRRMVEQSRRISPVRNRNHSPVRTWLDEGAQPLFVEKVQGLSLSVATSGREDARYGREEDRPEWEMTGISGKGQEGMYAVSAVPYHGPDLKGRSSDWGLEEDVEEKQKKVEEARTVIVAKEKGEKPGGYTIYKLSKMTI